MSHNSCNIGTRALPDMYALALGHHAYISGNALVPMLQLFNVLRKRWPSDKLIMLNLLAHQSLVYS